MQALLRDAMICLWFGRRRRSGPWHPRRPASLRSAPRRMLFSSSLWLQPREGLDVAVSVARLREPRATIGGVNLVAD